MREKNETQPDQHTRRTPAGFMVFAAIAVAASLVIFWFLVREPEDKCANLIEAGEILGNTYEQVLVLSELGNWFDQTYSNPAGLTKEQWLAELAEVTPRYRETSQTILKNLSALDHLPKDDSGRKVLDLWHFRIKEVSDVTLSKMSGALTDDYSNVEFGTTTHTELLEQMLTEADTLYCVN